MGPPKLQYAQLDLSIHRSEHAFLLKLNLPPLIPLHFLRNFHGIQHVNLHPSVADDAFLTLQSTMKMDNTIKVNKFRELDSSTQCPFPVLA
eukprot:jgi/Psemu1/44855/gm1.44855_g